MELNIWMEIVYGFKDLEWIVPAHDSHSDDPLWIFAVCLQVSGLSCHIALKKKKQISFACVLLQAEYYEI